MKAFRPSAAMASFAPIQSKCGTATPAPFRCSKASPEFDRTEKTMVDFSLTDADKRVAALAREEAAIGLTYARHYDKYEDEIEPKIFPEVEGRPDPLEVLDEIESETSGRVIAELLVQMETARGDVRMRRIKHHLGDKIVN